MYSMFLVATTQYTEQNNTNMSKNITLVFNVDLCYIWCQNKNPDSTNTLALCISSHAGYRTNVRNTLTFASHFVIHNDNFSFLIFFLISDIIMT